MDHVRGAFAADRADGEVDVLEAEAVGGEAMIREASNVKNYAAKALLLPWPDANSRMSVVGLATK
jgi:hypothetical protein